MSITLPGMNETFGTYDERYGFKMINVKSFEKKHIITSYTNDKGEKLGLVFITAVESIDGYIGRKNIYKECENLINCGETVYSINNFKILETDVIQHYKFYYTTVSFKDIAAADEKKILKIIAKSNLMYEI